jgi:hypothetical protein
MSSGSGPTGFGRLSPQTELGADCHATHRAIRSSDRSCPFGGQGYDAHAEPRPNLTVSARRIDSPAGPLQTDGKWHDDKNVVVRQTTDVQSGCDSHYHFEVRKRGGNDEPYWATVAMDSCVSFQERAKTLAINSSCLTRIGGCKTVESMIPQVTAETGVRFRTEHWRNRR